VFWSEVVSNNSIECYSNENGSDNNLESVASSSGPEDRRLGQTAS
jgi:hypothetical protein